MNKFLTTLAATALVASSADATILINETFSYTDGSLVSNAAWDTHSGTAGQVQVSSGAAILNPNSDTEDVNTVFGTVTAGSLYFAFDLNNSALTGTPDEYFAHFKDDGTDFTSRLHIDPATASGDYTLGISGSSSSPESVWATDLSLNTTYRIVVGFDFGTGVSTLWIDPSAVGDTNIVSTADTVPDLESFAFRQSGSGGEILNIDNLVVATTFTEALTGIPEPSSFAMIFGAAALGLAAARRRRS